MPLAGGTFTGNVDFDDNVKARFGASDDLQIYHDGSDSFITHVGTGFVYLQNTTDNADVVIRSDDGSGGIADYFRADGSSGKVLLYHYGTEKLATQTYGIDVTGEVQCDSLDVDGNVDITGTTTLHGNLDLQDNDHIKIGSGDDLQLYHNVYDSYIDNHLGDLYIRNLADDKDIRLVSDNSSGGTTDYVLCDGSTGKVALYHYGTQKFETHASGVTVTGVISDSDGNVRDIPQNSKTAAYTLVVGDAGKHINITTGGVTVPSGVFSTGDAVTIYNDSSSDQTVTQGSSVTLRSAGTADTGNRTLAQRGICTLLCVASNEFVISGAGLS
jgi:hypothetical protein